jgi:hypothetical protein
MSAVGPGRRPCDLFVEALDCLGFNECTRQVQKPKLFDFIDRRQVNNTFVDTGIAAMISGCPDSNPGCLWMHSISRNAIGRLDAISE